MLDDCPGTRVYCHQHDLSSQTLASETPACLLRVAKFDSWMRKTTQYDIQPPGNRIQAALDQIEKEQKQKGNDENTCVLPRKRNMLVIPDETLDNCRIRLTKIRRID